MFTAYDDVTAANFLTSVLRIAGVKCFLKALSDETETENNLNRKATLFLVQNDVIIITCA